MYAYACVVYEHLCVHVSVHVSTHWRACVTVGMLVCIQRARRGPEPMHMDVYVRSLYWPQNPSGSVWLSRGLIGCISIPHPPS